MSHIMVNASPSVNRNNFTGVPVGRIWLCDTKHLCQLQQITYEMKSQLDSSQEEREKNEVFLLAVIGW